LIEFDEAWANHQQQEGKARLSLEVECGGEEFIHEYFEKGGSCVDHPLNFTSSKSNRAVLRAVEGNNNTGIAVLHSQSKYFTRELPNDTLQGMDFSLEVRATNSMIALIIAWSIDGFVSSPG
jgi:hypothetical protein